jgi:hypothetical protein
LYNWLWTMAYLSGNIPAAVLLSVTLVCLLYFTFVINQLGRGTKGSMNRESAQPILEHYSSMISAWIVFFANILVVGTVNGLYIASTLQNISSDVRTWIQFSFGLFSALWRHVALQGLPLHLKESKYGVWLFACVTVVNSVLIPCLVTALSSPSCYQVRRSTDRLSSFLRDYWSHLMTSPRHTSIKSVVTRSKVQMEPGALILL